MVRPKMGIVRWDSILNQAKDGAAQMKLDPFVGCLGRVSNPEPPVSQ